MKDVTLCNAVIFDVDGYCARCTQKKLKSSRHKHGTAREMVLEKKAKLVFEPYK